MFQWETGLRGSARMLSKSTLLSVSSSTSPITALQQKRNTFSQIFKFHFKLNTYPVQTHNFFKSSKMKKK